jgi:peptidoglycan/LPS O-acetylase OafA/YrhL
MKKNVSVEWLRGLASFGVCEMHMFCVLDFFPKSDLFFHQFIFPLSIAGRLGVPVFFVISGFIIPYSMWSNKYTLKDVGSFILRRLTRLEPPYILSIILVLATIFGVSKIIGRTNAAIEWQSVLLHLGYINVFFNKPWLCGVYWTLAIEFQYYILIAFVFPLVAHRNLYIRMTAVWVLVAICQLLSRHIPDNFIFQHFSIFIVGILTFQRNVSILTTWQYVVQLLVALAIVFIDHGKGYAISVGLAAMVIQINWDIRFKPLYFLGKVSYSLYLIHWIIGIELVRTLALYYVPEAGMTTKIGIALTGIMASVGFSVLFYNFIEKRSIRWGKMLK